VGDLDFFRQRAAQHQPHDHFGAFPATELGQAMLADERANLYIAVQALRDIAVWAIRDGNDEMIQSRALDALRLIGKEDARG